MELANLILHAYPWWEMQRARELALRSKTPGKLLCNTWRHSVGLVDHTYRGITTPNCDTLYSGAWLDLADGPILIEAPDSDLPYWSIAAMDLNTDNIAIMGSHCQGSKTLLLCAQDYAGALPTNVPTVRSASKIVWLLARYLIGSDALVAQAESMRRAVSLGRWQSDAHSAVHAASAPRFTLMPAVRNDPKNFWAIVRTTLEEDEKLAGTMDEPMHRAFQNSWPSGVCNWDGLAPDVQQHFVNTFNHVLQRVTANDSGNITTLGQWRYPGSDIGNFGRNALYRAEVSLWGLGALPTSEVIYVTAVADEQGALLDGTQNYCFKIPREGIPAKAFWSMTMYEVDPHGGMYFVANSEKRYAIGDRTEGLKVNLDGSTDIWISSVQPAQADKQSNWLPAPAGIFRLMIRAYLPSEAFQSGEILPPALKKVS